MTPEYPNAQKQFAEKSLEQFEDETLFVPYGIEKSREECLMIEEAERNGIEDTPCLPLVDYEHQLSINGIVDVIADSTEKCKRCTLRSDSKCYSNFLECAYQGGIDSEKYKSPYCHSLEDLVSLQIEECLIPTLNKDVKLILKHIASVKNDIPEKARDIVANCFDTIMKRIDIMCLLKDKSTDIFRLAPDLLANIAYVRGVDVIGYVKKQKPLIFDMKPRRIPQIIDEHPMIVAARKTTPPLISDRNCWNKSKIMLAMMISLLFKKEKGGIESINWKIVDRVFLIDGKPVLSDDLKNSYNTNHATCCDNDLYQILPELKTYCKK